MTTLDRIEELAKKATPPHDAHCDDCAHAAVACERLDMERFLSPEVVLAMVEVIRAAKVMRDDGVELSRKCIVPPYMSEKAAVNEFIGLFDGSVQRSFDAALSKLEQMK